MCANSGADNTTQLFVPSSACSNLRLHQHHRAISLLRVCSVALFVTTTLALCFNSFHFLSRLSSLRARAHVCSSFFLCAPCFTNRRFHLFCSFASVFCSLLLLHRDRDEERFKRGPPLAKEMALTFYHCTQHNSSGLVFFRFGLARGKKKSV